MKIKLSEAKGYQIREFATKVLGLDIKGTESLASVKAKVASVYDGDEIEIDYPEEEKVKRIAAPVEADESGKKVKIIIQKNNTPGGSQPVFAAVNGRGIWIPRGEPVEIHEKYLEVLQNAQEDHYEILPEGGLNPIPRKVPVYPFQRIA